MSNQIGLNAYQQSMVEGGAEYFAKKRQAEVKAAAEQRQQTSKEQGFFGDMVDAAQHGLANAGAGLAETGYQTTGLSVLGSASQGMSRVAQSQLDQMSSSGRAAMQKQFFQDDENGNTVVGDAWSDPAAYALQLSSLAGQMVPQVLTGMGIGSAVAKVGGSILAKAGTRLAIARGMTGEAAAQAGVKFAAAAAGTGGQALAGAAAAGGMIGNQTRDELKSMSDSDWDGSVEFGRLYYELAASNPEKSVGELRDLAASTITERTVAAVQRDPALIAVNLAGEAIAGRYIDKLLKGVGTGSRLTNAGQQFVAQGATEALQGGVEQHAQNRAIINTGVNESLDPMSGVVSGALNEGALGGMFGGMAGAARKGKPEATTDTTQATTDQPAPDAAQGKPDAPPPGVGGPAPASGSESSMPKQETSAGFVVKNAGAAHEEKLLNARQQRAEAARAKRDGYSGLNTDIRIAEKLGFAEEAIRLKAAKKNFDLAEEFAAEGNTDASERLYKRGWSIYKEVMASSENAEVYGGVSDEMLREYRPRISVDSEDDKIRQFSQQYARGRTESAFTEQQGSQPGTGRDFPVSGEIVGGDVIPAPATERTKSEGKTYDGEVARKALPGRDDPRLGVRSDYQDSPDAVDWVNQSQN